MWAAFSDEYLPEEQAVKLLSHETTTVSTPEGDRARVVAQMLVDEEHHTVQGDGNGPIDAFVHGLRQLLGVQLDVVDYSEHAVSAGAGRARSRLRRDRLAERSDPLGRGDGLEHPHRLTESRGERGQRNALGSHPSRLVSYSAMSSAWRSVRPMSSRPFEEAVLGGVVELERLVEADRRAPRRGGARRRSTISSVGSSSIAASSRSTDVGGDARPARGPIFVQLLRKMSAKRGEITASKP